MTVKTEPGLQIGSRDMKKAAEDAAFFFFILRKIFDFAQKRITADCARPSDTLAAEKNFSDAHVVRKMI